MWPNVQEGLGAEGQGLSENKQNNINNLKSFLEKLNKFETPNFCHSHCAQLLKLQMTIMPCLIFVKYCKNSSISLAKQLKSQASGTVQPNLNVHWTVTSRLTTVLSPVCHWSIFDSL